MTFVSVGNVVVDLVMRVPRLPDHGGDVIAERSAFAVGGGFNTMAAARRQGMPTVYAGAHGVGPFGEMARAALEFEGIAVLQTPLPDADTGYDVAFVDDGGERTFVTAVGAEATLTREQLDSAIVGPDDFVHVSGYALLRDPNRSAIAGWLEDIPDEACVVVDPGPLGHLIDPGTLARVRARVDWWSCTERELALEPDPTAPTRRGLVMRRGADGCTVTAGESRPVHVPGFAVTARDTNGAGDAHVGGFVAGLADGLDPVAAARRANAVAALAVQRDGPATAPTRAEVDAFLAQA